MPTVEILNPAGEVQKVAAIRLNEVPALKGGRVAILDNSKPNFVRLATLLAERLQSSHGVGSPSVYRKENASVGATPAQLDEIARSADLVLTGSAD